VPVAPDAHVETAEDVLLDRVAPGPRCLVVDYHGHMPRALEGQPVEVHVVGDALAPRTIHDAILTATRAARRI